MANKNTSITKQISPPVHKGSWGVPPVHEKPSSSSGLKNKPNGSKK